MKERFKYIKDFFDLKKIYIIIFITLSLWSIFAYSTITNLINSQKIYAEIINLSGKQRMLSQKTTLIGKRFLEERTPELKSHLQELLVLMEQEHNYIVNNLTSQNIHDVYFSDPYNLNHEVKTYILLLKDFYENEKIDTLKNIQEKSFNLVPKLDYAVNIFEKESDDKTKELLVREQFILIGTLLTLLLEAIFIVMPSIKFARIKEEEIDLLNKSLNERIAISVEENIKKEKIIQKQYYVNQTAELITNIAHQWRQPLSVISTIASGMKIKKELNIFCDYKQIIDNFSTIVLKTQYLSNTIDQLDNLINTEDEIMNLDLNRSVKSILKLLTSVPEYNKIKILTTYPKEIIFIKGNYSDITNVFSNILNNAKDILNKRKIKEKRIDISISKENNFVSISIEDNAGGIDKRNIDKVFDMYFTTKHQSQGTGLGLYLTYIMIKKLEGNIDVENTNLGAKFTINLPIL
jgi:signal transduction histidine kinase